MPEKKEQESEIGVLKSIRYQNDNEFIIASFANQSTDKKRSVFSGLGNMANPEIGLAYKLYGTWETNSQFGDQFKFQFYEVMQPSDTKGIYQYLVRVCKWVGPTVAGRIVDRFKEDALDILKHDPERVAREVKGLTARRAAEIARGLKENEHIEKVLVELERIFAPVAGVRKSLPMELIKYWGSDAAVKIKQNPYLLTRIKGIGFPTADKLALSIGFDQKALARQSAAAWHVINENMQAQGSVWMDQAAVCQEVQRLTGLDGAGGVLALIGEKILVASKKQVAIVEAASNESYIAEKIARMV